MNQTPVFLHSTWRSGSTYLWAKFRARDDCYGYFEPLNEHLATLTPAFIDAFAPWAYANHPPLAAPYLEEFRPLLGDAAGLPGFPAASSYGGFFADRTVRQPELAQYFRNLVDHAQRRGRTPVFGCVRTELRLDWIRHHLDGVHIVLKRDPRRQFISCLQQAVNGNSYFLERGWVILGANRNEPALAPLRRLFEVPPFEGDLADRDAFYGQKAWTTDWTRLYRIAAFLSRLARRAADPDADLVLDMDRLAVEPDARAAAERAITDLTGAAISLADCRIERYDSHLAWSAPHFAAIEAEIDQLLADSSNVLPNPPMDRI